MSLKKEKRIRIQVKTSVRHLSPIFWVENLMKRPKDEKNKKYKKIPG